MITLCRICTNFKACNRGALNFVQKLHKLCLTGGAGSSEGKIRLCQTNKRGPSDPRLFV